MGEGRIPVPRPVVAKVVCGTRAPPGHGRMVDLELRPRFPLAPSLNTCVSSQKSPNLSEPQFLHVGSREPIPSLLTFQRGCENLSSWPCCSLGLGRVRGGAPPGTSRSGCHRTGPTSSSVAAPAPWGDLSPPHLSLWAAVGCEARARVSRGGAYALAWGQIAPSACAEMERRCRVWGAGNC